MKINNSFFGKIFTGYVAVLVLTLGVLNFAINKSYGSFIEDKMIQYNTDALSFIVDKMDKYMLKLDQVIYSIYQPYIFQPLFDEKEDSQTPFERIKKEMEIERSIQHNIYFDDLQYDIASLVVYKNDSDYFYMGNGDINKNLKLSDMKWYRDFVKSNLDIYVSSPVSENYLQFSEYKNDPEEQVILLIKKVKLPEYTTSGNKTAFIMLAIKFEKIKELFQQLIRDNESGLMIINNRDEVVYSWNVDDYTEKQLKDEVELLMYPKVKKIRLDKGSEVLLTSYFVRGFNWRIVSIGNKDSLLSEVKHVVNTVYLILLLGGMIAVFLSLLLSYEIVVPVKRMNSVIKQVERGNFDVNVKVSSRDEIGQLGRSFNVMVKKIKELIQKVYIAELKEKEAKLEALQAQINPHFLFNTLENINCIAQIEGVEEVSRLSQSLSNMFRYSIQDGTGCASVREEMEHVHNYMNIINIRFDNKIKLIEEIDPEIYNCEIIRLLLQPLVENSVQHGITKKISNEGTIIVSGKKQDDFIEIRIIDDGIGMKQQDLNVLRGVLKEEEDAVKNYKPTSSGIGIKNVHDRLTIFFGDKWGINIDSRENAGTTVTVRFPAREWSPSKIIAHNA